MGASFGLRHSLVIMVHISDTSWTAASLGLSGHALGVTLLASCPGGSNLIHGDIDGTFVDLIAVELGCGIISSGDGLADS